MLVRRHIIQCCGAVCFFCCMGITSTVSATSLTEFVQRWDKADVASTRVEKHSNATVPSSNVTPQTGPESSLDGEIPAQNQEIITPHGNAVDSAGEGQDGSVAPSEPQSDS